MKKNTKPFIKVSDTSSPSSSKKDLDSTAHKHNLSNAPNLSLVPSLELSTPLPSSENLTLKKTSPLTKRKLDVSTVLNHTEESHTMTHKNQSSNVPETTSSEANILPSYPAFDGKMPDIMDFYKGWMNFYQNQWQLFFKSWSQLLGNTNVGHNIFEEQAKEFQHHYSCFMSQCQECASIAQRSTQDWIQMMQASVHQKSKDADKNTKNNSNFMT